MVIYIVEENDKYVRDFCVEIRKEFQIVRPKCRWEDDNKKDIKEMMGCEGMDSI